MPPPQMLDPLAQPSHPAGDPYRGVVFVLLVAALLGAAVALIGGRALENPVLLDAAVTLGLSTGVLIGVVLTQTARSKPPSIGDVASIPSIPTFGEGAALPSDETPAPTGELPAPVHEAVLGPPFSLLA